MEQVSGGALPPTPHSSTLPRLTALSTIRRKTSGITENMLKLKARTVVERGEKSLPSDHGSKLRLGTEKEKDVDDNR